MEDGPWAFEQSLLILKQLELNVSPFDIDLTKAKFWIQAHNVPANFFTRIQSIKHKLGFPGCFTINCLGRSGGLALLWKERIEIAISGYSKNHIDTIITLEEGALSWRFTDFYGHPKRNRRRDSWHLLRQLSRSSNLP